MNIDIETLEARYFTLFNADQGLSIDRESHKIYLYEKYGSAWESAEFDRSEVVSVESIVGVRENHVFHGRLGIGEAIGRVARDSIEKASAEAATGIKIVMREIDLPPFFMNIRDSDDLDKTKLALSQFLEGKMHGHFVKIPPSVHESILCSNKNLRAHTVNQEANGVEGNGTPWIAIATIVTLIIGTLILLVAQP